NHLPETGAFLVKRCPTRPCDIFSAGKAAPTKRRRIADLRRTCRLREAHLGKSHPPQTRRIPSGLLMRADRSHWATMCFPIRLICDRYQIHLEMARSGLK